MTIPNELLDIMFKFSTLYDNKVTVQIIINVINKKISLIMPEKIVYEGIIDYDNIIPEVKFKYMKEDIK